MTENEKREIKLRNDFLDNLSNDKNKMAKVIKTIENALGLPIKLQYKTISSRFYNDGDKYELNIYSDNLKNESQFTQVFDSIKIDSICSRTWCSKGDKIEWCATICYHIENLDDNVIVRKDQWVDLLFIKVSNDKIVYNFCNKKDKEYSIDL